MHEILPTTILISFFIISRAKPSTFFFMVALNMRSCLSGRMLLAIERIWYSNPISNIRSASSNINIVQRSKLVALLRTISINRPGVATTLCRNMIQSIQSYAK